MSWPIASAGTLYCDRSSDSEQEGDSVTIGQVIIDDTGALVRVDAGFCEIMRTSAGKVQGKYVLDVTAPADRQECNAAIAKLRSTGQPFVITKRLMREDGSLVWVKNTVSVASLGGADVLIATVEPVADRSEERGPALLLETARFLLVCRNDRASVVGTHQFFEPAWDAVLLAYIAEAEGHAIDVATLSQRIGHPPAATQRWVKLLVTRGVLELETRDPDADAEKTFRLTTHTHRMLEAHLLRVVETAPRLP
jgi:PAS domain S-box-containing protein